jgi:hypothetical protein
MTESTSENMTEEIILDLNEKEPKGSADTILKKVEPNKETPTSTSTTSVKVIPSKRIDELTDEEKKILIENARAGIENPYYNVKLYKNGTTRICKSKKPTISQQAVSNKGERSLNSNTSDNRKVYMTDNQLIWEHVLELENKYNNLYRKHKKLKAKYNDLYIEDDIPTPTPKTDSSNVEPTPTPQNQPEPQPQHEQVEPQPQPEQVEPEQPIYQNYNRRGNWRSMLLNR